MGAATSHSNAEWRGHRNSNSRYSPMPFRPQTISLDRVLGRYVPLRRSRGDCIPLALSPYGEPPPFVDEVIRGGHRVVEHTHTRIDRDGA